MNMFLKTIQRTTRALAAVTAANEAIIFCNAIWKRISFTIVLFRKIVFEEDYRNLRANKKIQNSLNSKRGRKNLSIMKYTSKKSRLLK